MAHGLKDLPLFRQQPIYTAYSEGWALYAERLAAEIGLYEDDPFGDLGRLQAEMFRAVRLVVDTGLHAKGWTREQAIEYMVGTAGIGESEVISEVERYMALPGPGDRLQGRPAQDPRAAREGPRGARAEVQPEGLPHRRARERRGAAHRARAARRRVDRGRCSCRQIQLTGGSRPVRT